MVHEGVWKGETEEEGGSRQQGDTPSVSTQKRWSQ
jgi:hypothetical protein